MRQGTAHDRQHRRHRQHGRRRRDGPGHRPIGAALREKAEGQGSGAQLCRRASPARPEAAGSRGAAEGGARPSRTTSEVLAAYGKALAANGQLDQALDIIRRAQTPDSPDWRLLSAEAAILDQQGKNDEARKLYVEAQTYAPDEPSILSNLGMSYLLTGNLAKAEDALRKAAALPGADSRVRQNLALAVGLQGRFEEAEKIATAELSPEQAAANVAYLKNMLAQQNSWSKLKEADSKRTG